MFEPDSYRDIFNRRAASYHHAMATWPRARDEEFRTLLSLADIGPGHSVADLHSGGGYLSWYLPAATALYHLETSPVFAGFGRSGTSHPIVLIDEQRLPFADGSIDRVLSLAGLHHIEDKRPVYREISRVLKPGGIGVIADAHRDSNVTQFLDRCVHRLNPMGHRGDYLGPDTDRELAHCGLRVLGSELREYHWRYANAGDMASYCRHMFGMSDASEAQVEQGIEQYLGFRREDGEVKMNWNLYFIKLLKPAAGND